MKFRGSLAWWLIWRLFAALTALLAILAIFLTIWFTPVSPGGIYYWWGHAETLVERSLVRDRGNRLRIVPSPELVAYATEHSALEYAAIERPSGITAEGSSADLVRDVTSTAGLQVLGAVFSTARPRGAKPGTVLEGGAQTVDLPSGLVTVLVYGAQVSHGDLVRFWLDVATQIARYALPSFAVTAMIVVFVTRRATAPLRIAGAQASALDFRNAAIRLPEDPRVPNEILPLVHGINQALDRIEDDFRRRQRFTANAAHEIRTPLAILRARIDGLADSPDQGALRRDVQRIATLVDQMLTIPRLEQNHTAFEPCDLAEIAAAMVGDFAPLAADAGRSIAFVPPERSARARVNRLAVESAVANLIDNALHEEPPDGTVVVAVETGGVITVIDHGQGVAPDERDIIFEPFWRRDETRIGSGLGLAVVQEIAKLHGGGISVHDTPGGGATFRLTLPVVENGSTGSERDKFS